MRWIYTLMVVQFVGGCKKDGASGPQEDPRDDGVALESITVEPETVTLETGPAGAATAIFTATGHYADGVSRPLDLVSWTVSNKSAGEVDEVGEFTSVTTNGGVTWVQATLADVVGTATATVRYVDEVVHPDVNPDWFDQQVQAVSGSWLYPEDGVAFPRNTPSIEWQWTDPSALPDVYVTGPAMGYRLAFDSELTSITFYTPDASIVLDDETWAMIASTNAGGEVEITLEAAVSDRVLAEPPLTVAVQRMDATGSVIYWAPTVQGLIEIPFGGTTSQNFLTVTEAGTCVGCHSASKDGLFISYCGGGGNGVWGTYEVDSSTDMRTGYVGNFQSFSPDGRRLVATSYGNIDLYDAGTGDLIANILSEGNATHVDWAPDDSALVFSMTDGHSSDWTPGSIGRIAKMTHLGNGLFAAPEILFEAPPGWHAYYPAWSPDSQWIAFNVSTGDSYDDPDAELWLMYRNGDGVVRLDRANMGESLTNSWPRWGPLPDDDVLWLAFASRREYGSVKVNTTPQVWVTAIDPFLAADGVDPSKPAFWLPGQDTSTGNHIPVWSK